MGVFTPPHTYFISILSPFLLSFLGGFFFHLLPGAWKTKNEATVLLNKQSLVWEGVRGRIYQGGFAFKKIHSAFHELGRDTGTWCDCHTQHRRTPSKGLLPVCSKSGQGPPGWFRTSTRAKPQLVDHGELQEKPGACHSKQGTITKQL